MHQKLIIGRPAHGAFRQPLDELHSRRLRIAADAGQGQMMPMQLRKQHAETEVFAGLVLDILAADLAPAERFEQSYWDVCGHSRCVFKIKRGFPSPEGP